MDIKGEGEQSIAMYLVFGGFALLCLVIAAGALVQLKILHDEIAEIKNKGQENI